MEKINTVFSENGSNIKKIAIGSFISIAITLVALTIFSALLTYTNIKESTIPLVTIVISIISILIGSTTMLATLKKNGIINLRK